MVLKPKIALIGILPFFLTGCFEWADWVEGTSDLREFTAKAQATQSSEIEPLPKFKPYHSFVYEGASMREPFQPLMPETVAVQDVNTSSEVKPDEEREKEYLESFPLDRLVMVGTITKDKEESNLWALIKDEKAEVHRVTLGDHMGLDFGKIVSLNEQKVELIEIVADGRGGWMERPRSLALVEQE